MDMRRIALGVAAAALIVALAGPFAPGTNRAADAQSPDDALLARGKIDHVVVIVMENRTFDNVFGGDGIAGHPSPYPGANAVVPAQIATLMTTAPFAPQPAPGPNNWHDTFECVATGGFSNAAWIQNGSPNTCSGFNFTPPNGPFYYLDVPNRAVYWAIAQSYEIDDAFFAPGSTDSFPGHQFIVAGRSADPDGDWVADQPLYGYSTGSAVGCADLDTPGPTPTILVPALGPSASPWVVPVMRGGEGECYTATTFADRLEDRRRAAPGPSRAPFSWQHYASYGAPQPHAGSAFNGFVNSTRWWNRPWPLASAQAIPDAQAGRLPSFAWIKPPCINSSDHPGTGNGGPSWIEDVVNAIGTGPQWKGTAIFVIWDDWGGFYDHVAPPSPRPWDGLGPGLRTPFLVISPYVATGNVAHGTADYGSIMRFVEQLFDVRSLDALDAHSPDLRGFFDFSTARPFVAVTAQPTVHWGPVCEAEDPREARNFRD
jgi:phospholipase C